MAEGLELAERGEAGAVAALMTLYMGLRASEITERVVRDVDDGGRLLWIPNAKTEQGKRTVEIPGPLQPFMARAIAGRSADELLFGEHTREWPRFWVRQICRAAEVPIVCAHSMRGLHSTLALARGISPHAVAEALGHESVAPTLQSYAKPEAVQGAKQQRTLQVLHGGMP
jgi:integrase